MFRAPLCPSSGDGDYTDIHSMWPMTLVMANIPQPGRITYSQAPHLQPTITKVMCHMLWITV